MILIAKSGQPHLIEDYGIIPRWRLSELSVRGPHPEEEALADEKVQLEKILLWPLAFWPYCLPVSAETRRYPVVKGYA
jgi:hypothetical protein